MFCSLAAATRNAVMPQFSSVQSEIMQDAAAVLRLFVGLPTLHKDHWGGAQHTVQTTHFEVIMVTNSANQQQNKPISQSAVDLQTILVVLPIGFVSGLTDNQCENQRHDQVFNKYICFI